MLANGHKENRSSVGDELNVLVSFSRSLIWLCLVSKAITNLPSVRAVCYYDTDSAPSYVEFFTPILVPILERVNARLQEQGPDID